MTDGSTRMGEDTTHKEGPYGRRLLTLLAKSPDTSCESLCQLYTQAHKLKRMRLREDTVAVAGAALGKTEAVYTVLSPHTLLFSSVVLHSFRLCSFTGLLHHGF